jgi:DNA invertase Pin-like site-specific DNA recombinase
MNVLDVALENWSPEFIANHFDYKIRDVVNYQGKLKEKKINELRIDGYNVTQIMKKLNITRQDVYYYTNKYLKRNNSD